MLVRQFTLLPIALLGLNFLLSQGAIAAQLPTNPNDRTLNLDQLTHCLGKDDPIVPPL